MSRGLTLIGLGLGLRALGVAFVTLRDLNLYREVEAAGPPALRIGVHAVFGVFLIGLVWQQRAKPAMMGIWAYLAWNLMWLALFAQSDFDQGRWPFWGVTFVVGTGFVMGWWWYRQTRGRQLPPHTTPPIVDGKNTEF